VSDVIEAALRPALPPVVLGEPEKGEPAAPAPEELPVVEVITDAEPRVPALEMDGADA
jgi:hypothetical protein